MQRCNLFPDRHFGQVDFGLTLRKAAGKLPRHALVVKLVDTLS